MPGILPSSASSRKQIRQRLKSRIKPRGRPHLKQRRTTRLLNFGLRCDFTMSDFFAMVTCLGGFVVRAPCFSAWVIEITSDLGFRSLRLSELARYRPPTRLRQYTRLCFKSQLQRMPFYGKVMAEDERRIRWHVKLYKKDEHALQR